MLGLQETRSAGTPSTKTYNCVACSATFNGLASLLVHQASHANEISDHKVSTLPTCSHCSGLFASQELLEKHHCMVLPLPVAQDVYRCDCGEEFGESCDLQEHKTKHVKEPPQLGEPSDTNSEAEPEVKTAGCHDTPVEVLPSPCENSPSHCVDESPDQDTHSVSEADKTECIPTSDLPPVQDTVAQEHCDEGLQPSDPSVPSALAEESDPVSENEAEIVKFEKSALSDSEESANESEKLESNDKKSLLKMLASAYLSRRQPAQTKWEQSKRTLPPRKVSPRAPMQTPAEISTSSSGDFVNQLRQKVAEYGPAGEGCRQPDGSLVNVKPKKKKKIKRIVSTTKTLYPVVALETCQKLVKDNIEGKHQCGVCRRVFQDVDSLIMHHALHKKERVKYCRRCRQYLICVISVPNNHICSVSNVGTPRHFTFVRKSFLTSNNPMMLHSRKLFHCTLCNRSYTRRHNLNKHNCQWIASLKCSATSSEQDGKVHNFGEGCSAGEQLGSLEHNSARHINVGVNTGDLRFVKTEELTADFPFKEARIGTQPLSSVTSGIHLGSAKSFPPFLAKVPKFSSVPLTEFTDARMREGSDTEERESLEESQWTVPLDDTEIDVMMDVDEEKHHLVEAPKDNSDDVVILEPAIKCQPSLVMSSKDFQVHISESGVKRFSCNRCQRSYSRRFTVKQHLKICGARKLMEQRSFGKASILALKKKFPCPHCGTSFTRKDNMNIHRKRCQSIRNASILVGNRMLEKKNQASQENMFVLPPVSKSQARQESGKNSSGSGNWGIMSLPSVLPRRVTCECGAAFTCPRLLFEHLQLHAMESYICSHCGENLQSWAEFEAHQKLHAQTPRQKGEQLQHFQAAVQNPNTQPQDLLKSRLTNRPLTEPCVCHRCKKIFGGRKSLLRHLRLSCRGDVAVQRKHCCSRCGMTFQSPLAHKVHVQSNNCTPSFKPMRCPVCVRWFSCVDGLKRHLVSHSQQKVLTCPTCRHKCSSHEDLEEHKRKVHGTKEASASPTIQSAHVSQSDPSNAFRCQICQRSYPKLQSLKDHLRKVHRPQGLNQVGLGAGGLQSAVGAMQQSQSKQYQCQICARAYPDIQSLRNHRRRVHRILGSGLQPSKAAGQQSHSSQFQCHICSRSYPDLRSLRNHRRRVHRILGGLEMFKGKVVQSPDNPFKCQICQRGYPDVRSLKNHRRRVHRILGDIPDSAKVAATDEEQSKAEPEVLPISSPSETASE
ncbi:uncharacterized protein [Salminus brasiliensis]|uniref:uncharacterized protein n=1 Tax=Salminus brasiliensis TaxID=930266 RepID=UPI003B839114